MGQNWDAILNSIVQSEGTRVYHDPMWKQKLKQLSDESAQRDLVRQTGEFNLEQLKAKGPLELEALKALTGSREATAALTGEKVQTEAAKNDPAQIALNNDLAKMKIQLAHEMDPMKKLELEARIRNLDAQARKADRPPAEKPDSFAPIILNTPQGPATFAFNRKTKGVEELNLPGGKTGPAAPKPNATAGTAAEYHKMAGQTLDELERVFNDYSKARSSGDLREAAEKLATFNAQVGLMGNILGRASGDTRVGDKERPVYARVASATSDLANVADPGITLRRIAEARKFLESIKPAEPAYLVGGDENKTTTPSKNKRQVGRFVVEEE